MHTAERHRRYRSFETPSLPSRTWPDRTITTAPRWLSTDLRDGNQALASPMTPMRKLAMFDLLIDMGYREIEVGFPVAGRDDYDFVRTLIEQDRIPADVRISVLVPAREDLIRRTTECLRGTRSATIHMYNATCPRFRDLVFGMSRGEVKSLAVEGTRLMMKYADRNLTGCEVGYQYSPELFNETEPEFALEVCEAVMDEWQPGPDRPIILNFPTTVERSTPNTFADRIEWLDRNISRREFICLSVHPHNDRGTGVATAEMALLAGAERIEGCLFGSGERAGNVCLVTLGLNLFTQGVDPQIDFSDLNRIRRVVEDCTGLPVPQRHPYGGELVFTAFSGSHQDAIKKGFDEIARIAEQTGTDVDDLPWRMPYLPLDPKDVGRDYEAVVRINSQSGKGGVAYVMSAWHGLHLPRGLQIEFAAAVQALADEAEHELGPTQIKEHFDRLYVEPADLTEALRGPGTIPAALYLDGTYPQTARSGLTATLAAGGIEVFELHAVEGAEIGLVTAAPTATVYAACSFAGDLWWGAGTDADLHVAAMQAVRAAVARGAGHRPGVREVARPAKPVVRDVASRLAARRGDPAHDLVGLTARDTRRVA